MPINANIIKMLEKLPSSNAMDLTGLGLLAAPSAYSLATGKEPGRVGHGLDVAGLGLLGLATGKHMAAGKGLLHMPKIAEAYDSGAEEALMALGMIPPKKEENKIGPGLAGAGLGTIGATALMAGHNMADSEKLKEVTGQKDYWNKLYHKMHSEIKKVRPLMRKHKIKFPGKFV